MLLGRGLQNSAVAPDEALAALGTSRENASRWTDGDLAIAKVQGANGRCCDQCSGRQPILRRLGPVVA